MTSIFNVGDRVRCIDGGSQSYIQNGREYEVLARRPGFVKLVGVGGEFYEHRFAPIGSVPPAPYKFKTGDRVRCVARGPNRHIHVGSEYTVTEAGEFKVMLAEVPHTRYDAVYFELIPATPKVFRVLRKGVQWGTTNDFASVEDAEAVITKSGPVGEPLVIVELTTVKTVTVKRVLEAA